MDVVAMKCIDNKQTFIKFAGSTYSVAYYHDTYRCCYYIQSHGCHVASMRKLILVNDSIWSITTKCGHVDASALITFDQESYIR